MRHKKNLDGIQNQRLLKPIARAGYRPKRGVLVDSIFKKNYQKKSGNFPAKRRVYNSAPLIAFVRTDSLTPGMFRRISRQKVSLLVTLLALFLAFGGGMWLVYNTSNSSASSAAPQVLGAQTDQPANLISLPGAALPPDGSVSNEVLFNTPLVYLKQYLAAVDQPDILARRTEQIKQYLKARNSPLASVAETIAVQPHWDIIMAVAFAESSWGKNCSDNNCSNIGVKPGAPSWRRYSSYNAWVVDFNRLLDKKYKDWTLKQMCGVYVQPCNPNWLLATQQVLDDFQTEHIE